MSTVVKSDRVTFGLFEADLTTGELWKAGFRIRLPGQPFKVLAALVSRPGEVITREELQAHIWGSNTNVDFERALAGAVNKVREALGDSADNPRFIETLTKRGYRFIAPVALLPTVNPEPGSGETPPIVVLSPKPPVPSAPRIEPPSINLSTLPAAIEPATPVLTIEAAAQPLEPSSRWSKRERILATCAALLLISLILSVVLSIVLLRRQADKPPLRLEQLTRYNPISVGPPNMETLLTLAADGDRVLTSVMVEGVPRLSAIYTSTGDIQPLTMPSELASNSLADISRDGSRLLLRSHLSSESEQPLWVVPSAGGSALRVGNVLAHDAAWMPDGESVLYASGDTLSLVRLDNGSSKLFAHLPGRAFWLRWSPNGKLLRFTLMDPVSHSSSIWELASGSNVARPVEGMAFDGYSVACGTWTADGSAFIFQVSDAHTSNLWELIGSGPGARRVQLTNGPLRYLSPVASRSGTRIFFMGLSDPSRLQQFSAEQHSFQPAPDFLADANRVDYSRDGQWVAWTDTAGALWRARASDGSEKLQLTPSWLEVFLAHWSPDGTHLALMARSRKGAWQIYRIEATGGTPEALLHEKRNAADPGWSADGREIVFGREPDLMGKETGPRTIQILNLATQQIETLPGSDNVFSPRWSPDGRYIAALAVDQKSVRLFDMATRQWKTLVTTSAADPVWSSDSRSLFVHAYLAPKSPILKVSIPDGTVQTIASLADFHNGEPGNYFFGGLTPANAPLVQPHIGTGDLYTLDLEH